MIAVQGKDKSIGSIPKSRYPQQQRQESSFILDGSSTTLPSPMTSATIVGIAHPDHTVTARQNGCTDLRRQMAALRHLTAKVSRQRIARKTVNTENVSSSTLLHDDVTTKKGNHSTEPKPQIEPEKVVILPSDSAEISRIDAFLEPNLSPMPDDERLNQYCRPKPPKPTNANLIEDYLNKIHDLEMLSRMEDSNATVRASIQCRIRVLRHQLAAAMQDTEGRPINNHWTQTKVNWEEPIEIWDMNEPSNRDFPKREKPSSGIQYDVKITNEIGILHRILENNRAQYNILQQENQRLKDEFSILENLMRRHEIAPSPHPRENLNPELSAALDNLSEVKMTNQALERDLELATEELAMFRDQFYKQAKESMAQPGRATSQLLSSNDEWKTVPKAKYGTIVDSAAEHEVKKTDSPILSDKMLGNRGERFDDWEKTSECKHGKIPYQPTETPHKADPPHYWVNEPNTIGNNRLSTFESEPTFE